MDRRAFILTLTPKAKEIAPKLAKLDSQMIETLKSGISEGELESFYQTLKKIQENLRLD